MNEIAITDTDFCRFRDYFYEKTGIFLRIANVILLINAYYSALN